ncbi:alpha/beta fold hydrolase [Thalassospira mesophila]|uniref:Alpha/beta hydrolase n=1 Tax=Thalassospira mesophila TaxID=1293891 RepID=A0A1Y2L2C0_9PROT|nr:alpha/beta hydrolase [Thalassospira mesophila]OSQ39629.1 alpha/beta hydrolase [Thalassospira mesophila]
MFEGFREDIIAGDGADIFVRHGGNADGPGLLLLHGYPQTSAMWHKVAPQLADKYHVVCADLRGYGRSSKPETDAQHSPYSKRAMAADMVKVMAQLGHSQFYVGAHDRGARVAHRMGMDHAGAVKAIAMLDIAPTREMYRDTDDAFARAYWHWFYLIQPAPFPETMIGGDPDAYWKFKCKAQSAGASPFAPEALDEYLTLFRNPAVIHASCEDYRAGASIDIAHDDADGDRKLSMPLLAIWGGRGVIERCFDALALWRARAENVNGFALPAGHYLAEEIPDQVATQFLDFFDKH